jgi:hypothetical protein
MRLPDLKEYCGCDNRQYVMFEAGRLGMTEAIILAAATSILLLAWKARP